VIFFAGFFGSMAYAVSPALLTEWFPLSAIGIASGFLNFLDSVGSSLGPLIYGWVLEFTGSFVSSWGALSLIALTFSIFALMLIKYEKR
jgi:ACS family hexuronate transporter-like MFS transporter